MILCCNKKVTTSVCIFWKQLRNAMYYILIHKEGNDTLKLTLYAFLVDMIFSLFYMGSGFKLPPSAVLWYNYCLKTQRKVLVPIWELSDHWTFV